VHATGEHVCQRNTHDEIRTSSFVIDTDPRPADRRIIHRFMLVHEPVNILESSVAVETRAIEQDQMNGDPSIRRSESRHRSVACIVHWHRSLSFLVDDQCPIEGEERGRWGDTLQGHEREVSHVAPLPIPVPVAFGDRVRVQMFIR
jgi:hypothetical protein